MTISQCDTITFHTSFYLLHIFLYEREREVGWLIIKKGCHRRQPFYSNYLIVTIYHSYTLFHTILYQINNTAGVPPLIIVPA